MENIIYYENFNGDIPFNSYVNKQIETAHGLTASGLQFFSGAKSGRFELRDTDPMNNNGTRAEISFPPQSNLNRWYSFAVYFPSDDYKYDEDDELINQWHQGGGVTPAITLGTKLDKYRLIVKESPTAKQTYDLGPIAKDKWNTFVFHIKHSSKTDGLIELWLNGQKVVSRNGINMYDLSSGQFYSPKWKLGIYKSAWNGTNTTLVNKRVLYYDEVKIGSENATYEEMIPARTTSIPTPDPEPIPEPEPTAKLHVLSFILVNAATEKDVLTIEDGQTISLKSLGLTKANIRAVISSSDVGSVKFELSGKQRKTFTDNSNPFALHGDDGEGNYYYGNWKPPAPGTYTLKATPYGLDKNEGISSIINFTIIK